MIKKIVYVVEALGGGVLTYLNELANGLSQNADIYILYGRRKQTPSDLGKIFNSNINLIEIRNFQRSLNIKNDFKAYLEVERNLLDINPNIVHLNSSKAGALGRILKLFHFNKFKKTSFFYTPHGYSFLMKDSSKLKRIIYYLVELCLSKLGAITIACGKGEYKVARKLSKHSTYVNNGINVDYLNNFWSNKSNTEDVVFTIGRINEQKNPDLFNQIALQFPSTKFVWVGDGPLINHLTSTNIKVTGWLSSKDVLKQIQPYNKFILCSRWEGLPISLLEAMYYKKICCVTNVIGNNDIVVNEHNGILFSDLSDLVNKKRRFKGFDKLTLLAHETIMDTYSLDQFISKYKNIYNL